MNLDLLRRLAQTARYLPRGVNPAATALAIVPALADGVVDLAASSSAVAFPVSCTGLLQGVVERAVRAALDEALADLRPVPDDDLSHKLENDPLTQGLSRLIGEGATVSRAAAVLPVLEYARLTAAQFARPSPLNAEKVKELNQLPVPLRAAALARVANLLRARTAIALHGQVIAGAQPGALAFTVASAPFCFVFNRQTLEPARDLPLLAEMSGVSASSALVTAGVTAMRHVIGGLARRVETQRTTLDDQPLIQRFPIPALVAQGVDGATNSLLLEPEAWAVLLPRLSRMTDAKQLAAAGLQPDEVKLLLRSETGIALASLVSDTVSALREWDVLQAVLEALHPVSRDESMARRMLVPRGGPTTGAVVALALGPLRASFAGSPGMPAEVDDAWALWTGALGQSAVAVDEGAIGLVVFGEASHALRFALALADRPVGGLGSPAAAVAVGAISGGTDGGTTRLAGPAIQDAIRLLAQVPLDTRPEGMHRASRLAIHNGSLSGVGVSVDDSALPFLRTAYESLPKRTGGLRGLQVVDAWETEVGITVLARIPGLTGGLEALHLSPAEWDAYKERPKHAQPAERPGRPPPLPEHPDEDFVTGEGDPISDLPGTPHVGARNKKVIAVAVPTAPNETRFTPGAAALAAAAGAESTSDATSASRGATVRHAEAVADPISASRAATVRAAETTADPSSASRAATVRQAAFAVDPVAPSPDAEPESSGDPFGDATAVTPDATAATDPFATASSASEAGPPASDVDPLAALLNELETQSAEAAPVEPATAQAAEAAPVDPAAVEAAPPEAPTPRDDAAAATAATAAEPPPPAEPVAPPEVEDDPFSFISAALGEPELRRVPTPSKKVARAPVAPPPAPPEPAPPEPVVSQPVEPERAPEPAPVAAQAPPPPEEEDEVLEIDVGAVEPPRSETGPVTSTARHFLIPEDVEPLPVATRPRPEERPRRAPSVDFAYLLNGYASYVERDRVVFGRPYGTRLIDHHSYDTSGNLDQAYRGFLADKIREGFIPQTELVGELPRGVTVMPLDHERLATAWRDLS